MSAPRCNRDRPMSWTRWGLLAVFLVLGITPVRADPAAVPAAAGATESLRVCADPNNLPYSNEQREGFENALADLVAHDLGRDTVEYTWRPQRRGFVRNTLRAGHCDLVMGVPANFEMAQATRPYYRSTYVFVYRSNAGYDLNHMDDPMLRKLRIGVHMVGDDYSNTPGAAALGARGMIDNLVGFSVYGDYSQPHPPSRLIEAVADGEIDVAIAWGPLAGYFAPRQSVPLTVVPVSPEVDHGYIPFTFAIAMAVRRDDATLKNAVERVIEAREPEIRALLEEYGVPLLALRDSGNT